MGAGAVGCYYGGLLARAGHEVTLVGRAAHVEAIRRDGLLLETTTFVERVPVTADTDAAALAGARLVLFCVKSTDTEAAGRQIAPHLDAGALVVGMQNGVDNADRLRPLVPCPVAAAVVYVATGMAGPGHVRHHGRGELVVEDSPRARDAAAAFEGAGVPVQLAASVAGELWAKLVLNCAWNALSAIAQLPYGRVAQGAGVEAVMRDVVAECLAVARAAGVEVPGDAWEAVQRIARTMPGQSSSTAQDLARGRASEIDHLNGYVVRTGERLGVATPANRVLHAAVKLLEDRHGAPAATGPETRATDEDRGGSRGVAFERLACAGHAVLLSSIHPGMTDRKGSCDEQGGGTGGGARGSGGGRRGGGQAARAGAAVGWRWKRRRIAQHHRKSVRGRSDERPAGQVGGAADGWRNRAPSRSGPRGPTPARRTAGPACGGPALTRLGSG